VTFICDPPRLAAALPGTSEVEIAAKDHKEHKNFREESELNLLLVFFAFSAFFRGYFSEFWAQKQGSRRQKHGCCVLRTFFTCFWYARVPVV
jgi:hypothetical protein